MGAKIRARHAREEAQKAAREADLAEAYAWSVQMDGYGGPAQPSPTIGQCIHGGLGWLKGRVQSLQNPSEPAARCDPQAARHSDLVAGSVAEVPVVPKGPLRAARAHDQTDRAAGDHAVQMGAS